MADHQCQNEALHKIYFEQLTITISQSHCWWGWCYFIVGGEVTPCDSVGWSELFNILTLFFVKKKKKMKSWRVLLETNGTYSWLFFSSCAWLLLWDFILGVSKHTYQHSDSVQHRTEYYVIKIFWAWLITHLASGDQLIISDKFNV